jgi:HD-GYP domain-containing protein (c-di-GMP phosphodiesterase class II)
VAIPVTILAKGGRRSSSEWETYRLHPYYTQQILERATALQDLAQAAAAHHEWINGQGYHRRLGGEQIPFHGRILAVANSYTRLLYQQGDQTDQREVLRQMRSLVGTQFDSVCYEALVTSMIRENGLKRSLLRSRNVSNLTEREVEVLSQLAQGYTNTQIARMLHISTKTIEHHLSHIYTKIGVTSRTAAVVYAVQQGLV